MGKSKYIFELKIIITFASVQHKYFNINKIFLHLKSCHMFIFSSQMMRTIFASAVEIQYEG